jgi:N-acetylneuraminic acid mutarotase
MALGMYRKYHVLSLTFVCLLGCFDNTIRGAIEGQIAPAVWICVQSTNEFSKIENLSLTDNETNRLFFVIKESGETETNVAADWEIEDSTIATLVVASDSLSATLSGLSSGSTQIKARKGKYSALLNITIIKTSPPPPLVPSFAWTWMAGPQLRNQFGVYGTKGVEAAANFPGSRSYCAHWTDSNGDFWLFGGSGYGESTGSGALNDLWRYRSSTGHWTWVSGEKEILGQGTYGVKLSANVSYSPSARSWTTFTKDDTGKFWLIGGGGVDSSGVSGLLDDVWKFNPTTTEWTWVAGSSAKGAARVFGVPKIENAANTPGAREWGAAWINSNGYLYLFGGSFPGMYGWQGDFWRLNSSTGEWAHLAQQTGTSGGGNFGVKGVSAPTNYPGRRYAGAYWTDSAGVFWLWGGEGNGENGSDNYLNDLWKYDATLDHWTYMTGGRNGGQAVLGTKLVANLANTPGQATVPSWTADTSGNLYLLGGYGRASSGGEQSLNLLFKFNTTEVKWTWLAGTDGGGMQPVWGALGTTDPSNQSGWREGGGMWIDSSGGIWYFGGTSLDQTGSMGKMSDFWHFF